MNRAPLLPSSETESPILPHSSPPPSPPPLTDEPHKNPWRISPSGGGAATTSVTLMGEPSSSWPPLSSSQHQRRTDSPPNPPPPEVHPPTATGVDEPSATDLSSSSSSASSSSSSSSLSASSFASLEETVPPSSEPPAMTTKPASPPPPPAPAPVPPPSPGNAAAPDSPRPPPSPQRRGRNQKFHHHRGGGGPRYNKSYGNRPAAPGRRPNWNFDSSPQYPQWGFHPGPAVAAPPPADFNNLYVPYPQPYNGLIYPDHGLEPYVGYYNHRAFEIPYAPPLTPTIAGLPPPQAAPDFSGVATRDHQIDMVKDQLLFQIEYYFSDENLVKDAYLKRQMDGEGWVDIHVIAGFRKVAGLTEDINLIKDALQSSNVVELQGNKMRKRHEWDKWILQPSAQNSLAASMQSIQLGD